ncbi:helix-turn-helix domain-containing protein [Mangrovitalea sediminis]|uniref:helix-turn-helix domain-containing protein n=1 Tax=Mangrovitalea sediminis TaxID=1982043 RepID=UPI000BE51190|nr:helix-turn-helix transcriptional regulator [Mangrovitalea sediminis]
MRYLRSFNRRLQEFRDARHLTDSDIAALLRVDDAVIRYWEMNDERKRTYPSIDNLLDLCLKTETPLEHWLDLDGIPNGTQLQLPGLAMVEESDLGPLLEQLQMEVLRLVPSEEEKELLRRFRRANDENRRLILQLMS